MKEVYLSREIENDDGYIDSVIDNIKAVPQDEELHMLITCIGGDTFQGDRIYRAISEHGGKTKAVVIGAAISMGASILPAFDSVEIDPGAELMYHSARPKENDGEKLTDEQKGLVERFNKKTMNRMINNGVNPEFVKSVFVDGVEDNHWLTAKEAEALGIGTVVSVDKESNKSQLAIAAKLDISHLKLEKKDMDLFKKSAVRIIALADGRKAYFDSKSEELKKGDKLTLVGSTDVLSGKIKLENNLMAELSEMGLVENIEEPTASVNEVTDEMFADLSAQVAEIKEMVMKLAGEEATEEEVAAVAKKHEDDELEDKAKADEVEAKVEAANDLLNKATVLANTLTSTFVVPTIENKNENVQNSAYKALTDSEKRVFNMKQKIKELK